jgi:monoamine oxidase
MTSIGGRKLDALRLLEHRRQWLKTVASAALMVAAPSCSPAADARSPTTQRRIAIIGAGMAGLHCALLARAQGHDVTVLEAQDRVGGRVQTARREFSNGMYAEDGATYIPATHVRVLGLVQRYGLSTEPRHLVGEQLYYTGGHSFLGSDVSSERGWPYPLTPMEKKFGFASSWGRAMSMIASIRPSDSPGWPPATLLKYDGMTVGQWLRDELSFSPGLTELASLLAGFKEYGDGIDSVSALSYMRTSCLEDFAETRGLVGGMDRLPVAMAKELGATVRLGTRVLRLEQDSSEVRVTYAAGNSARTLAADRVVCTLPFSVLRELELPGMSPDRVSCIKQMKYHSDARVHLQVRVPFWRQRGLSGDSRADLPVYETNDSTWQQSGTGGILSAGLAGRAARDLQALPEAERIRFALRQVQVLFPELEAEFVSGVSKCWDEDPFARGAYPYFEPGELTRMLPYLTTPEGRIHFAGEHTSPRTAWIEGALESAERALEEIERAS